MGLLDRLGAKLRHAAESTSMDATPDSASDAPPEAPPVWQLLSSKSGSHLYFLNPDHVQVGLLDLVDRPPKRVLDVGCYCGATGEAIKRRWPGATVIGIEPLAEAAELASARMDRVIVGTLESVDFDKAEITPASIDTVVLADVLEHIYNPWLALQRLRDLLTPDGVILASIPNVRNLGLIHHLAGGHWSYQGGGLLDITHIRFFTLNEVRKMFAETGYTVDKVAHNVDPSLAQLWDVDSAQGPTTVQLGSLVLNQVSAADRKELATLQFYVRATRFA